MKKVLFAFEIGQPCYRESYVYAAKVARNLGAELIMLHAFEIEVDDTITQAKYEELIKINWVKAYQEIIRFDDYYLQAHARIDSELRVKVDHRIINGLMADEFRKILHSEKIDLVVLPAFAGSEPTQKMLKLMRREALNRKGASLLVTPHDKEFQQIDSSLFLFGLKRMKGIGDYAGSVSTFTRAFGPSIHIIHLSKHSKDPAGAESDAIRAFQKSRMDEEQIRYSRLDDPKAGRLVLEYLSENEIQLVLVPKQQRHAIGDLLRESMTDRICLKLGLPLLYLEPVDQES